MKNLKTKLIYCPALDNNKCFISNDKCKCDDYKQCELYKTYVVRPNYDSLSNSIGAVYFGRIKNERKN